MATPGRFIDFSTDARINGLVQGHAWSFCCDSSHTLTYSLSLNDTAPVTTWTAPWTDAVTRALTEWSNVANITFQESGSGTTFLQSTADIAVTLTGNDLRTFFDAIGLGIFPDPQFADITLQ